jgi:hypothetical protein
MFGIMVPDWVLLASLGVCAFVSYKAGLADTMRAVREVVPPLMVVGEIIDMMLHKLEDSGKIVLVKDGQRVIDVKRYDWVPEKENENG